MLQLDKHDADFSHLNLRKENHGDKRVPAATLTLNLHVSALVLDAIDKKLRPAFFEKPGKGEQQPLPIDENNLTALKLPYLKEQKIGLKFPGYELEIAGLLDHIEPLFFADVELVVDKATFNEGGNVALTLKANTRYEADDRNSMLDAWERGSVRVTVTPPNAQAKKADDAQTGDILDAQDKASAEKEAKRLVAKGKAVTKQAPKKAAKKAVKKAA